MLLKKRSNCRCLGCHDAHVASALYIDTGSQLYMLIHIYSLSSFLWSFRYFFCNYFVFQFQMCFKCYLVLVLLKVQFSEKKTTIRITIRGPFRPTIVYGN